MTKPDKEAWKDLFQEEPAPSHMHELSCLLQLSAPACVQLLGTMVRA